MHSFWHRVNTALTFFATVAGGLCILTAGTDLVHRSSEKVTVSVAEVKRLVPYLHSKDQALITFDLDADLRSVFSWNTKQLYVFVQAEYETDENKINHIVLWDSIVEQKDKAHIRLKGHKTKYAFIDQGKNLRGRRYKLSVVWNVMPKVGHLHTHSASFDMGSLPGSYRP